MPILLRSCISSRAFSTALSRATSPSLFRKRPIAGPPLSAPVSSPLSSFSILMPVGSGVVGPIPITLSAGRLVLDQIEGFFVRRDAVEPHFTMPVLGGAHVMRVVVDQPGD